jgi:hypothetical protein
LSTPGDSLLDAAMPRWDFDEMHSAEVAADPATTYEATRAVTMLDVRTLAPLMALRTVPVALRRPRESGAQVLALFRGAGARPVIEQFLAAGFLELAAAPGREYVVGAVGRFWSPAGNAPLILSGPAAFRSFDRPGFVKAALNFRVEPLGDRSRLVTETRIVATSPEARRSFGRYWRLILPGSALIRRSWLAAIRRRAERDPPAGLSAP